MSFPEVLAAAEPIEGGFRAAVPPDWHQGRTAYGGFSSALALTAAMRLGGELPPLRSTQVSMIAPLVGKIEVRAREVRRGRNVVWMKAEIAGEKGVGLTASFAFMRPVESVLKIDAQSLPDGLIAPEDGAPLSSSRGATFLRHNFDVRFALPKSTAKRAEMCWWARARDRTNLAPIIELLLCADVLPPGVMPLLDPTVPVSTMHWQANILTAVPQTDRGWWLLRSTGDHARSGFSSQRMSMWNTNGQPIMAGLQSIAIFG